MLYKVEFFLPETIHSHRYLNSKYTKPEGSSENKVSSMKPNWHFASMCCLPMDGNTSVRLDGNGEVGLPWSSRSLPLELGKELLSCSITSSNPVLVSWGGL